MEDQYLYSGKLYLIPTTLGEKNAMEVLPASVPQLIDRISDFIVENEKSARRFIKFIQPSKSQSGLRINLLNKFTQSTELPTFLEPCKNGMDIGLLSEAGCPGIADPGAEIVRIAHLQGIRVIPLVGPSSILLAMMGSGMNGQNFAFHGYLPIDKAARKNEIKSIEKLSREKKQAGIFIETPYRNQKLLEDLLQVLHGSTNLCVARDITQTSELILTKTVSEWKKIKVDLHKRPAIFIIQT